MIKIIRCVKDYSWSFNPEMTIKFSKDIFYLSTKRRDGRINLYSHYNKCGVWVSQERFDEFFEIICEDFNENSSEAVKEEVYYSLDIDIINSYLNTFGLDYRNEDYEAFKELSSSFGLFKHAIDCIVNGVER